MKPHQGYVGGDTGAICSECGDLVEPGSQAVLMEPVNINERGSAHVTAKVHHGLLCEPCYEEL